MDIYRYFHPHHNPRLFSTPLRQQELSELEQAAAELRKALERARLRTERAPAGRILPNHFEDLLKAVGFLESSLQTLCDAHDGDDPNVLEELVEERLGLRGWEGWTRIVKEQLASEDSFARDPLPDRPRAPIATAEKVPQQPDTEVKILPAIEKRTAMA
jgi:type II secretory pathway pseudopilin PulG